MPRPTGVFDAIGNITFGALSVRERPFHSAKPNAAMRTDRVREHVREESVRDCRRIGPRVLGSSIGSDDTGDRLDDGFAVRREIICRAPGVETVAEVFVELSEQRIDHREATRLMNAIPPASVASVDRAQTPIRPLPPAFGTSSLSGTFEHHLSLARQPGCGASTLPVAAPRPLCSTRDPSGRAPSRGVTLSVLWHSMGLPTLLSERNDYGHYRLRTHVDRRP